MTGKHRLKSRIGVLVAVAVIGVLYVIGSVIYANSRANHADNHAQKATESADTAKQQADQATDQLNTAVAQGRQFAASVQQACGAKTLPKKVCDQAAQIVTEPAPARQGPRGVAGPQGDAGEKGADGHNGSPAQRQVFTGLGGITYDCARSGGTDVAPVYSCTAAGGSPLMPAGRPLGLPPSQSWPWPPRAGRGGSHSPVPPAGN